MLSVFPVLFDFSLVGVMLLRVSAGLFFLIFGARLIQAVYTIPEKGAFVRSVGFLYGVSKILVGVSLTLGIFTQIGALLGMILSLLTFLQGGTRNTATGAQHVQLLLFIICISLLFLGPGVYAFDYPL